MIISLKSYINFIIILLEENDKIFENNSMFCFNNNFKATNSIEETSKLHKCYVHQYYSTEVKY
jgi:hypothetical protein